MNKAILYIQAHV